MIMCNLEYQKRLTSALSEENGCVVLINGEWGVGKTFFWNEYSENQLKDKPVAYVSLFGKNNINDVQSEALIQIFKRNKYIGYINKITDTIKSEIKVLTGTDYKFNLGIAGNSINLLLSLLKAKELKNSYVCIDDFERKGEHLKSVEVIGYASILSERFGCKVILIMDEDKVIASTDGDIYKQYKEKMIDFEIKYKPAQNEVILSILSNLKKKYKDGVLEAVSHAQVNNLRTIKRIALWVELLDKNLEGEYSDDFCSELGFRIALLVLIYFEYGNDGLHKLSARIIKDIEKKNEVDESLAKLNTRIQFRVSSYSELDTLLWNFIDTLALNHEILRKLYVESKQKSKKNLIRDTAFELLNRYTFDLTYTDKKYIFDLTSILEENKHHLVEIFNLDNLVYILNSLIDISKDKATFEKLKIDSFSSYVDKCLNNVTNIDTLNKLKTNETLKTILDIDDVVNTGFQNKIISLESKLRNSTDIESLLKRLHKGSGWNPEDETFLDSIPTEILEDSILHSKGFLEELVNFMRWRQSFKDSTSFDEFYKKAAETLKKLGEEKFGAFRYNRLVKILNIH